MDDGAHGRTVIAENLSCIRGGRVLFRDLSFTVPPGRPLVVVGRNGAGKSTLLRMVAGLLQPSGGSVRIRPEGAASRTGYLGHRNGIKANLRVSEHVAFWARFRGRGSTTVREALRHTELENAEDMPAGWLSAGQQRRLALATLIASDTGLWLLDEPTANLDERGFAIVRDVIARHCATGGTVLAANPVPLPLGDAETLEIPA